MSDEDSRVQKKDLREGMVVEMENGRYGPIGRLPYGDGLIIIDETERYGMNIGGYVELKLYTDDLRFKERTPWGEGYDIKNVYDNMKFYWKSRWKKGERP